MISSVQEYLELLERRSTDAIAKERLRWDEATVETWTAILDEGPELASAVSLNKKLPAPILMRLARDADWRVRDTVAMKRTLPLEVLEILATDEDEAVRRSVACHRTTPREIVERLARDEQPLVAEAAQARLDKESPK